ncbi:MAG: hypothetical protein WAU75_13810 [Solirubrobacteraceae bacterium]
MISLRLVCAVTMTASVAVAGCGSGRSSTTSRVDFKTGFATSQNAFRQLVTDIAKDLTGAETKTDAELAKEFGVLGDRADRQASRLATLTPPARYATRVRAVVAGCHALKADLSKLSTAATHNDAPSARTAARALLTDAAKVKTADTSLSKALGLPSARTRHPGGQS